MSKLDIIKSAIFAGICIGIAGFGFLANPVLGTFLFCVGLIAVVQYKAKLFTGTAGFVQAQTDVDNLFYILFGNIIGCGIIALIAQFSGLDVVHTAQAILIKRMSIPWWNEGILAIGCGFLMTTAVTFARKSKEFADWLPLLFAVPAFIICGFPHCIADSFYYLTCIANTGFTAFSQWIDFILMYVSIVLGNFIGCNLYRLFIKSE